LIVSAVGFVVGEKLWAFFSPSPALVISEETTRITEPLAPDGLPDYFQAVMNLEPRGIPPETNAAAAVWEVIPSETSSENAIDHSQAYLSAADQRPESDRLVLPPPPPDGMDTAEAERILEECSRTPWRAADQPWLARWLEENRSALDTLAAGARREGWCPPRCLPADRPPTDRFGPTPALISLEIPVEGAFRSFSKALLARSMLRLGEGDTPGAWHDLDSLLRYGDKIADTPGPLVCRLVAMALLSSASGATQTLIRDGHPADTLLAEMQRSLRSAIDWAPLAESVDTFERLYALDAITAKFTNPSKPMALFFPIRFPFRILAADPNVPLRAANIYLDAIVDAVSEPTRDDRRLAWQVIADTLEALPNSEAPRRKLFQPCHETISERLSRRSLSSFLPDLKASLDTTDRAHAALVLADCAAAIERHRLATGQPPASLADLVPAFLAEVPLDPFTDSSIGYRIADGRWTLWSGTDPEDDAVDDLVLRGPGRSPGAGEELVAPSHP
jgi:hypothetical protein